MAFKILQAVIPTPAAATQLGSLLAAADQAFYRTAPLRTITFQMLKANTGDVFVGDSNLTSASIHGFRVDATDSQPPIVLGGHDEGPMKLDDFWIFGTAGDTLLVSMVPY